MQQATLLESVVGDVAVGGFQDRPARQQGVAVLAPLGLRIGVVGRGVAQRRQKIGLRLLGPVVKKALLLAVVLAHLLQADDVGIHLFHRQAQVVDFQPAHRSQALHPFVDVVGGHTQNRVVVV